MTTEEQKQLGYSNYGSALDVARVDEDPEPAAAPGTAEWNSSGETGSKILEEVFAMRADGSVGTAFYAHEGVPGIVGMGVLRCQCGALYHRELQLTLCGALNHSRAVVIELWF
jgi:hypothetical protein